MELYLRVGLSFAAVGLLLWLFARIVGGRLGARLRASRAGTKVDPLAVVERRQLTKNNAVAIVRAGRRHLLVGYGEEGVRLLAEGDDLVREPIEVTQSNHLDLDEESENGHRDTGSNGDLGPSPKKYQSARTRLEADRPTPPRMSLMDTLREKTVRRS